MSGWYYCSHTQHAAQPDECDQSAVRPSLAAAVHVIHSMLPRPLSVVIVLPTKSCLALAVHVVDSMLPSGFRVIHGTVYQVCLQATHNEARSA